MPDFIVTTSDGQTVEVSRDQVKPADGGAFAIYEQNGEGPKGFFTETQLEAARAKVRQEAEDKAKGLKNPADLEKDPDFHKRVFKHLGIQLDERGLPVGRLAEEDRQKLVELDRLRSENEAFKQEKAEFEQREKALRDEKNISEIRAAFEQKETYLRRDLLKSRFGKTPGYLTDASSSRKWDDNHGCFVFHDEAGNVVMKNGKPADAGEFARLTKKRYPEDFEDRRENRSTDFRNQDVLIRQGRATAQQLASGMVDLEKVAKGEIIIT